jgi:hypothetical protein
MGVRQMCSFCRICCYVYESKIGGYEEMSFSHISQEVREKEIWPPSSPYCNPFDYFARGVSELRVRANPPTTPET